MARGIERRGRRIVDVRGDGNCFYRALSQQINDRYDIVREEALIEIILNPKIYQSFIATVDNSDNSMYKDINHYIESHSHNRVWADNLMVQAAANAYSRNIEIVNEHGCTVTIDARQSTGRNLVITFNSKTQHYQSTEEACVHFNIGNRDVDIHIGSQDKDVDKQDDSDGECPQHFKDILKTVGDCGSDNTDSDEEIDNSFKKESRSLHNNGGLRQILIDGKTDETKNPMLILKDCGQKGLAQLSYVNDAYPEYYRLHKRMSKKQNYFNYIPVPTLICSEK